jgi:hypothetical protein
MGQAKNRQQAIAELKAKSTTPLTSEQLDTMIKAFEDAVNKYRSLGMDEEALNELGTMVGLSKSLEHEKECQTSEGVAKIDKALSLLADLLDELEPQADVHFGGDGSGNALKGEADRFLKCIPKEKINNA